MAQGSGIPSQGAAEGWETLITENYTQNSGNFNEITFPQGYDQYLFLVSVDISAQPSNGAVQLRVNGVSSDYDMVNYDGSTRTGYAEVDPLGNISGLQTASGAFIISKDEEGVVGDIINGFGSLRTGSAVKRFNNNDNSINPSSINLNMLLDGEVTVKVLGRNI